RRVGFGAGQEGARLFGIAKAAASKRGGGDAADAKRRHQPGDLPEAVGLGAEPAGSHACSTRSSCRTPIHQTTAMPNTAPGTATRAVRTSVWPMVRSAASWKMAPVTSAPAQAP